MSDVIERACEAYLMRGQIDPEASIQGAMRDAIAVVLADMAAQGTCAVCGLPHGDVAIKPRVYAEHIGIKLDDEPARKSLMETGQANIHRDPETGEWKHYPLGPADKKPTL